MNAHQTAASGPDRSGVNASSARLRVTPGPWLAVEVGMSDMSPSAMPVYEVQTTDGRRRICEYVWGPDAHLIAAAPELLEALRLCAAVCAGQTMHKAGLVEALEQARAAIAKAEGRA